MAPNVVFCTLMQTHTYNNTHKHTQKEGRREGEKDFKIIKVFHGEEMENKEAVRALLYHVWDLYIILEEMIVIKCVYLRDGGLQSNKSNLVDWRADELKPK